MTGRGGGWVVGQFAVIALIVAGVLLPPRVHLLPVRIVGIALCLGGVVLFVSAYRAMGRWFTIYPRPLVDSEIITSGPFALVRHPIYGSGLLFFSGASLNAGLPGLVGTAVLALLWWRKAALEERLLLERSHEYTDYLASVRRRFVPWVV